MKSLKVKVFDFILRADIWSRKEGSEKIRKLFGDEGYQYYQDLWKRGCLRINDWACLTFTKRGWEEERAIKSQTSEVKQVKNDE